MSRSNVDDALISGSRQYGTRYSTLQVTISGDYTIEPTSPIKLFIDGGVAPRDVRLPAVTPDGGQEYWIYNNGADDLNLLDSEGMTLFALEAGNTAILSSTAEGTWKFFQSQPPTSTITGPLSSVDGDVVVFSGTSGQVIADSGVTIADLLAGGGGGGDAGQAVATAAPPTYVEGATEPLSMDLTGHLRVLDTAVETVLENNAITLGQATMANSVPVVFASDQDPLSITTANETFTNKGFQQLTGIGSATALTVPSGATLAIFTVEASNVRWRDDGTNPTASVGMLLVNGQSLIYNGELSKIKFIDVTSGAKVGVSYYQ